MGKFGSGDWLSGTRQSDGSYVQDVAIASGEGGGVTIAGPLDGDGNVLVSDTQSALVATAIGTITDAAWDGTAPGATVISLLKKIALNTTPAP